jgi:hypothetical protein
MKFKQGTNKAGKSWAGWFCSDRNCPQEPQWERKSRNSIGNQSAKLSETNELVNALREIYKLLNERLPKNG